jgi:hypothetical protein
MKTLMCGFGDCADARQIPPNTVVSIAVQALKHDAIAVWYNIKPHILSKGLNPEDLHVFKEHMTAQWD